MRGGRMKLKKVIKKDFEILCREGTSDEFIVKEVLSGEYRKLSIDETDIICDIGQNIGVFSLWAVSKGAKKIYGFEAEPENSTLAKINIEKNGYAKRVDCFNEAVVGTDHQTRPFSFNTKKNKGAHSLVRKKGRTTTRVKCKNINKIFEEFKPSIVKMDIEGGEIECLHAVKSFKGIRELILEYHHAHLNDKSFKLYISLLKHLSKHFASLDYRKPSVIGGAWTGIIHAKN